MMFSENKHIKQIQKVMPSQNILSQRTKVVGEFTGEGDFRVDGVLEGSLITTGKVVLGKTGFIKGNLQASEAYFEGEFKGKLHVLNVLTLKKTAYIEGDVEVGKLVVEPGATFNGTCVMKSTVKEINNGQQTRDSETEKTA